ncbi:hypothetical protein [Streptosporangium sp. NPDC051022]|uniref:hypothetical protein n=1 Tax=Streptosporangium sp. NPDC051022 TaxID=3155752 RepID=UPI0034323893
MTQPCPHRHADPRMCPDCRRERLGPASTDPDIAARWDELRSGLTAMLRPYVQQQLLDDLVRRAVAELISGPGWKPPLRLAPAVIRDARVQRALAAQHPDQEEATQ